MKSKVLKQMITAGCIAALVAGLAACGSGTQTGTTTAESKAESTNESVTGTESEPSAESVSESEPAASEESSVAEVPADTESTAEMTEADTEAAIAEVTGLADQADVKAVNGLIYCAGYEWGSGVPKVIVELPEEADEVIKENAGIVTAGALRNVKDVYLSDDKGNNLGETSLYVTFELDTTYTVSGSPFTYSLETFQNDWSESYPVQAAFKATIGGEEKTVGINADLIDSRICPDAELFSNRNEYTGSYVNPMTNEEEELTLRYAAYEPETLSGDEAKNPLIIWLHGQGEGGKDPDICIIGNEVCALAKEDIQKQFTSEGGENGAYVLVVQCETYWMDGGDGTNSNGDVISRYRDILMDTIKAYVDSNPDIDTNRIYLGGCSNGGYMTMHMLVSFPEYWAAAYPCCEAYSFNMYERDENGAYVTEEVDLGGFRTQQYIETEERWMTDGKLDTIKDIPIWFTQSADDTVVNPTQFAMPTYRALLNAGAENKWFSMFETVMGTDDPSAQYMGHFAWVYLLNNQVTHVQDTEAIKASAEDDETFGFTPSNDGGGAAGAVAADGTEYAGVFDWMNAQSK